jgi:predicted PurR-regulated permease PerM
MTTDKADFSLPELSTRQLVTATVIVAATALAFWLLFRFHQVILILLAGIIVSIALNPVVERLRARGVRPGLAVGLLYGVLFVGALLFLRFGAPIIGDQAATIGTQLAGGYQSLRENLLGASNLLIRRMAESLPERPGLPLAPPASAPAPAADPAAGEATALGQFGHYAGLTAKTLYQAASIFLIGFFWTIEAQRIKASAVALLPLNGRDEARDFLGEVEQRVSAYVVGQLALSLIIGGLSFGVYLVLGLPFALALAIFVGIMEILPVIGPLIGAIPAVVIGLSISPTTALWTVVASLIIHQLEANVFGPRIMKRALGMRPLVTLLALTAFGSLFGVLGAIVALPLASALQMLFDRYLMDTPPKVDAGGNRDRISVLRYEIQSLVEDARKIIRRRESELMGTTNQSETVEDTLEAIALDLDSILAQYREEAA